MTRRFRPFQYLKQYLPKTLLGRTLVIIIAPIVLLQLALTYTFFERHWDLVTRRLSSSVAADIAMLIQTSEGIEGAEDIRALTDIAAQTMELQIDFEPGGVLPPPSSNLFFSILDQTIRRELAMRLGDYEFWFNTRTGNSYVDIQVALPDGILKVTVRRSRVHATNWHIFLVWMLVTSSLLLGVAVIFLRNQIRPIQRLAQAAESFGKGRDVPDFKPSGAEEVRSAAMAFIDMQDRIKRHIEQRTEMLAGVSHDLRTPLTRLKLQLALLGDDQEIADMRNDLRDMEHMLDEYLDFARGAGGEEVSETDLAALIKEISEDVARSDRSITVKCSEAPILPLRRQAMKRCIANLVENACDFGNVTRVSLEHSNTTVDIAIEDDGPGIEPANYDEAFGAFNRLDVSRNLERSGVGLGLTIARDIARAHGGDITLSKSNLGGLKAVVSLPV